MSERYNITYYITHLQYQQTHQIDIRYILCYINTMDIRKIDTDLRDRSSKVVDFLQMFTSPDFQFSIGIPAKQDTDGYWTVSHLSYDPETYRFFKVCRDTGFIDPQLMHSSIVSEERSHQLRTDPKALECASIVEIGHYLTFLSRAERFADGTFARAFEDHSLIVALGRLKQLSETVA